MREPRDGFIEIVHTQRDASAFEGKDLVLGRSPTALRSESERELAGLVHHDIRRAVLVAECMTADHNGLYPAGYIAGYVAADNRLSENCAVKNIADGAVG